MNFMEISPGKFLRKSEVIDVSYVDEMNCKLATKIGIYDCIYPAWRILILLEEKVVMQPQSPVDRTNLFGAQHFSG